jgi:CBS-domain-containing membrane protein
MSPDVLRVPKEMSLARAAHLLTLSRVSGAPVVDTEGRCIGVLSTTDFLNYAQQERNPKQPGNGRTVCAWQIADIEEVPQDRVADYMTTDPVTAAPTTKITELARMMIDAHIHRIIIVDEKKRPVGVVSSTDILAAVAHAEVVSRLELD